MLSESPANTLIKDPIYGYVELTDLERRVIETSVFQRLRFITQNGLAFYTYPALRGSRFEHSIGACHLAGRVMTAVMENSDPKILQEFFIDCYQDVGNIISKEIHDALPKPHSKNEGEPTKANPWDDFMVQLVRLFALFHDLGHLPFSHLGEDAVEEFVEQLLDQKDFAEYQDLGCKLHEYVGFKLISGVEGDLRGAFGDSNNKIYLDVLRGVYLKKRELKNTKAFRLLYELIDSDIDVDRGDYLRRDGYNSGIGFGRYDIDRLIQSIRVDKLRTDTSMRYLIAPSDSSISPVEDFLLERFKLYKWLYFHHSIRFFNACLVRALKSIIELRDSLQDVYPEKFRLEYFHYSRYVYKDGFICNEIWLWDVFYKSLIDLKAIQEPSAEVKQAVVYLEVIVNRAKRGFSVWKTQPEYLEFNQKLKDHLCRPRPSESAGTQYYRLRAKDLKSMPEARVLNEILKEILNGNEESLRKDFVQRFCKSGVPIYFDDIKDFYLAELKDHEPLGYAFLNVNKFDPFKESSVSTPDNIVSQFEFLLRRPQDGAKVIRLTDVSRLIKSLYEVWQSDIQSNLYFVVSSPEYSVLTDKGSELRGKLSEVIRRKLCEQLAKWLEEQKIVTVTS
jgi:uncharacterized protein